MRAAYMGILTPGSTSRMRAEWLRRLTPEWEWDWLDTDAPLLATSRIWQSLAYRYQIGRGANRINEAVERFIKGKAFDLVWVDKAIFLTPRSVRRIREVARRLVHFTPDTAFHANRSANFERTIGEFDLLVTTKSFEMAEYRKRLDRDTLFLTTQGFDPDVHYPRTPAEARKKEVVFVGLAEPDREKCIAALLEQSIPVRLAGQGWSKFLTAWGKHPMLHFEGESVFGDDYALSLSSAWIGLGLLSKRFPELHTTRTFEIPACGTILATESNKETRGLFSQDQALFFNDFAELGAGIHSLFAEEPSALAELAEKGRERVLSDGRDYPSILSAILADARVNATQS